MSRTRSTRLAAHRRAVAAVTTVAAAALAGCSSTAPAPAADAATPDAPLIELTHVHGAAYDPGDSALLLATHHGLRKSPTGNSPRWAR
jgi:hypothetical protein